MSVLDDYLVAPDISLLDKARIQAPTFRDKEICR